MIEYNYNDGGREKYFKGKARDCVTRAIAIATGRDYKEVYDTLAELNHTNGKNGVRSARNGINTKTDSFKKLMRDWGFEWTPTMKFGSGCQVHLRAEELPKGRIVCAVSKHYVAVIDGVINDTYDCSRGGSRCVYGYWTLK